MRGNSLRFFKPPVFIKTFLVFCAIFAAQLFSSCKQLASFDPGVDGARVAVNKTFAAPTGVTATQGRKRIISLEWTPVSGARYYDIYCAKSATAEFAKVGETNKNSFDDKVGAGSTMYYKVCAVKSNGTQSAFSTIVKGTSLAQPVISGIVDDKDDFSVTISWFMENACGVDGRSNYEDELKFEVFCEPKNGGSENNSQSKVVEAKKKPSSYECAFENLASSTEYQFYVVAYLDKDQQNTESSPKVDKTTLTSYMPLAPEFTVSQGESAQGIRLFIKLPEKVMVQTETKLSPNKKVNEPYPLYFKVSRVIAGSENYEDVCDLYYNGTELTETPVEYEEGGKPYEVGKTVGWFDDYANLIGGVKYEYKIISCSDTNAYDKIVCPEGKENNSTSTLDNKASKAIGWKSALPSFKVKSPVKTLSENKSEVLSYEFGFDAEWKDLGKAGDYKFAIKQNRRSLGAEDSAGEDTWLDGGKFFETLEELTSHKVKFGSNSGLDEKETGLYAYTLYIVSKDVGKIEEALGVEGKELCHADAIDKVLVTKSVNLPKPEFTVKGGYKDKVDLTVSNLQPNVTYEVTRTTILKDGIPSNDSEKIPLYETGNDVTSTTFTYPDEVQGNCRYSYILKATDKNGGGYSLSESQEAETLGTPDASFNSEALGYDSVTISFDKVLAAESYTVQFGASNSGFGGGATFEITKSGEKWVGSSSGGATAKVDFAADRFTVTIEKPEGYDDATKAGDTADLTVTAKSDVDNACKDDEPVPVNVLGPALLDAKVNAAATTDESISLTWSKVEGAKGYLIRRVMYSDAGMTKPADGSGVTYYCDASDKNDKNVTVDGAKVGGRCTVTGDAAFTLTDTYMEKSGDNADLEVYHEAQAKIAWGLPFRYVVLPVFDEKDFDFESNSLALKSGSKVMYNDLTPTKATATWGYGLNLVAEKAMSGNEQGAKWNKPHVDKTGETDYTTTKPVVYRRTAGDSGKFERFRDDSSEISDEKAIMAIKPGDNAYYGAFEYIVKYYPTGKSTDETISPPDSLLAEIAKRTAKYETPDGTKIEQDNKGYLLTIENFLAEIDKTKDYYEKISWKSWNYNTRAVGPDTMTIFIQNNNISADPKLAVEIVEANAEKTINYVGSDIDGASLGASSIHIKPKSVSDNGAGTAATDGLLKVLRDYKHNYTFELQRAGDEKPITVSNKDYDASYIKTAYRQITIDEFIDISAMSIGECLYNNSYSTVESVGKWANDHTFTFKDDSPTFYKVSGELETSGASTTEKPIAYGARRPNGRLSKDESKPCTLTLSSKDAIAIYDGKVTIDLMKRDSGKYTVEFNNGSKSLEGSAVSRVSQYFTFE